MFEKDDLAKASGSLNNVQMNVIYVPHVKIVLHCQADAFGAKNEKNAFNFLHIQPSIYMANVNPGSTRILNTRPKHCKDVNHVT